MRYGKNAGKETLSVWGGEESAFAERSTQVPVFMGVAHAYEELDEWIDVSLGKKPGHIYGRNSNPTVQVFEEKVRLLEGAEAATSAATGMGIISSVLCALLDPGERVVSIKKGHLRRHHRSIPGIPPATGRDCRPLRHDRSRRNRGRDLLRMQAALP